MNSIEIKYSRWLYVLSGLFCFRVFAQLIQAYADLSVLPSFESWQGSALPYPVLFLAQVVIILVLFQVARKVSHQRIQNSPGLGNILFWLGLVYFVSMLGRLFVGLFILSDHPWFGAWLPAIFHLVLASYVLLLAGYYRTLAQGSGLRE